MSRRISSRNCANGGVVRYPSERLLEEVAYIAYHFHWSYQQIMTFEHRERQQWVAEVMRINQKFNGEFGSSS
ncbi:DUF6760 family protein [Aerosakkonema sp. BLCC-F183]|uniref:DUF6760 family protein n=1 Tax=Aerosakkonema sp. BLCC-F183 TaxID=3342834 RepID=UPI0035B825A7